MGGPYCFTHLRLCLSEFGPQALDLGLELAREIDLPMPVTAATREMLQAHFGVATLQKDPEKYLAADFAALMETMALAGGMKLVSENKKVPTGLES